MEESTRTMPIDVCRTCGAEDGVVAIFGVEGEEMQLAEKINSYLPITVFQEDKLPLAICQLCISRLESCHQLVLSCLDTDDRLKQILSEGGDDPNFEKEFQNVPDSTNDLIISNKEINSSAQSLSNIITKDGKTSGLVAPNVYVIPSITKPVIKENTLSTSLDCSSSCGFFCDGCNIWYKQRKRFMAHQLLCPMMKTFECLLCNYEAKDKADLGKHTKLHSDIPEELASKTLQNECNICKRVLSTKMALKLHLRTHSGEKPYSCQYCKKMFAQKSALKYHEKTHIDTKPFYCRFCNKGFNGKMVWENHERIHTGERPYQCVVCNVSFRCLANLRQHQPIHSEEKSFKCPVCQKMFRRPEKVRIHLRTHTGEKPYVCPICYRGFTQKGDMVKHKLIHPRLDRTKQILRVKTGDKAKEELKS